jgi:prevent-host-death family protein
VNKIAIFEAKNRLTHIIREAEKGDTVELTRHGKPVAVLVGIEKYAQLKGGVRSFSRVFNEFKTEWSIDVTRPSEGEVDPFENIRSLDSGRDISL